MKADSATLLDTPFKKEVFEGLTSHPKYLSSKFIYDKRGDALFQDIMNLPEYYLTGCELKILQNHTAKIAEAFKNNTAGFDLIELGAGDGKKTKVLLHYLVNQGTNFTYKPIDISQNAIDQLSRKLSEELPKLQVDAEKGEYFEVLERLKTFKNRKKVIMVLGSNIGNLLHAKAIDFLSKLGDTMDKDDLLFMGFDQKKDPQTILDAYNDATGVTAAFNKNILHRINSELGGNFEPELFNHWETYDPESGTAKSYLVATQAMQIKIPQIETTIDLGPWETIHVEISQKYDDETVGWLAEQSNLCIETSFQDDQGYYKNYILRKK